MADHRIGIISDTHGQLRPAALAALRDVELILHAGDVGRPEVLEALSAIAPVIAVRGNVDRGAWAEALPKSEWVSVGGIVIHMLHIIGGLDIAPAASGADVVVSGHSHQPSVERRDGVLYINPGSAGPRRFSLPVTLAILERRDGALDVRIVDLLNTP